MNAVSPQFEVSPRIPLVLQEDNAWTKFMDELSGKGSWQLLDVSRTDTDQRVFRAGDRILKVKKLGLPSSIDLEREASFLQDLARAGNSQYKGVTFERFEGWHVLNMPRIEGKRLDEAWAEAGLSRRVRVTGKLISAVSKINRRGISHRDLRAANILVSNDNEVTLLDFGQARELPWPRSLLNDSIGIPGSTAGPEVTLTKSLSKVAAPWMSRPFSLARQAVGGRGFRETGDKNRQIPIGIAHKDSEVSSLHRAWQLGSTSDATAIGEAYYSLNVAAQHLPGERPWPLRWDMIRRSVSFEGKNFVELGCNLGLLSSYALLHGAESARGVDINPTVVEGARNVAEAWDVPADFAVLDIDSAEAWEERYAGADIVSALSLYNWVRQKDRLLKFLGCHKEVLYEGHDSLAIECSRLRSVGFTAITVLGETERNRWVLYASKR
jgi:serine/threonine protein kinase